MARRWRVRGVKRARGSRTRRVIVSLTADVLVEPRDRPLPRLIGGRFVVALRRRVVVEAVNSVRIDVALVRDLGLGELLVVVRPRARETRVLLSVMHEH